MMSNFSFFPQYFQKTCTKPHKNEGLIVWKRVTKTHKNQDIIVWERVNKSFPRVVISLPVKKKHYPLMIERISR